MTIYFFDYPQFSTPAEEPYNMPGWIQGCRTLSSMTSLRYLCIFILQELFNLGF